MRYLRGFALPALIVLLLAGPLTAQASNHRTSSSLLESQIQKKQKELTGVRRQIGAAEQTSEQAGHQAAVLEPQVRQVDARLAELRKKLVSIRGQLEALTASRKRTESQIRVLAAQLARTVEELNEAIAEVERDQKILNRRARDTYVAGKIQYYEVLVASKSFSDFLTRAKFLGIILENDRHLLERVRAHQQEVQRVKVSLEQSKRALQARKLELAQKERRMAALESQHRLRQGELQTELARKSALLAQARATQKAAQQTEAQLKKASGQITQMIKRLEVRAADARQSEAQRNELKGNRGGTGGAVGGGAGLRVGRSGMIWPTSGPLTSGFGWRTHPLLEYVRMHEGVDIGAGLGQPIYAARAGTVIMAGWYNGYGNTVIIDHGNGLSTLYAHASELFTNDGAGVQTGELVAAVGTTGFSTGPHLHFEVRENGAPVDPMKYY